MNDSKAGGLHYSEGEQSLDLYSILIDVGSQWYTILLLTMAAGLVAFVLLSIVHPLKYATKTTMVVTNVDENISVNNSAGADVFENLNYAADSASRLKNVLDSQALKSAVAKELGLASFEGNATATTVGESNLLEITVRAYSPYISYKEAESILRNYTDFSGDLVGGTELTVLERPKVTEKLEHPLQNVKYAILIGGLVFLALCTLLAVRSYNRDTIRSSRDVESKVDANLLAAIMHEDKHSRGKKRIGGEKASILITDPVTSFQYVEGMRKLATRVMNEMLENHHKTLLISSAMENEGKSTVAVNIALAMAQIDKRVLLVDMDFRKPSMYRILNMQDGNFEELSTFLGKNRDCGRNEIFDNCKELITKVPGTDLSVVLNRKSVPQAMDQNSEVVKNLIDGLKEMADYIIIDTAPISLVSDAEELASMVDACIIVVRQHLMEAKEINDTIDALGGKKHMLGCVFNNARKSGMISSTSGYSYNYGGNYGG